MDTPLGINILNNKNYNVIIAEDSFIERQILKRFLQSLQFNILTEATSGEDVLDYLKYSSIFPDILFLDYQMENKNAVETIKEIKPLYPEIKIVIVTSNTKKEVIAELAKLKIQSYILKPINKNILDEKLIELLGRKDLIIQSKVHTKKHSVKLEDMNIPPLPGVAHKILIFESNSVTGSSELEQIILPDKSICADLLRISNSVFYARSTKVQTIKDAITLLGLKTVKDIVMLQSRKHISKNLVYSDIFKKYLLELPILVALIAFDLSLPLGLKSLREDIFLLGMMRKVGMTILALNFAQTYTEILNQCEANASDLSTVEKAEFEVNHIDVGIHIFKVWEMPPLFLEMMKNQNFTIEEFSKVDNIDRLLRVADIIGRKILGIPILDSENILAHRILKHYNAPEGTMKLYEEEYYDSIKSHPFFDSI